MILFFTWLLTLVSAYDCLGALKDDQFKSPEWNNLNHLNNRVHSIPLINNDKFNTNMDSLLRKKYQNLVYSPLSISLTMAMLIAGARGETLNQINKVLRLPPSPGLQVEYRNTIPVLRSTQDFTIETSNKVFIQNGFSIKRDFQHILRNSFHSDILDIDFKNSKAATKKINGLINDMTRGKIKNLINPSLINQDTHLIFVNAMYLKSYWAKKFNKAAMTKFQIRFSKNVLVPIMTKIETVFFANLGTLSSTMVELPYKGDKIVMQVLLPNKKSGLEDLEDKLKDVDIHKLFEKEKKKTKMMIELPKFKLETTMQLTKELQTLGLKKMFSVRADFSGISSDAGLHVSDVFQKAIIEVDEEGTEEVDKEGPEAATIAVVRNFSKRGANPILPTFTADHPFIFYLREKESGVLLFQGRVIDPSK